MHRARRVALHRPDRLQGRGSRAARPSSSARRTSPTLSRNSDLDGDLTAASGKYSLQRLPEPVPLQQQVQPRRRHQGAAEQGPVPEPGRAEPDRDQRQGSQLPGRRRVSLSGRAGRRRQQLGHDHVQGVRRPPELHADRARRRPDQPEGQARSQLARLRQRGHRRRLPHPGAVDAPHRDRSRAARRTDVRDRRPAEQHRDRLDAQDSRHRRHPDSRLAVQEQGGTRRTRPSWSS